MSRRLRCCLSLLGAATLVLAQGAWALTPAAGAPHRARPHPLPPVASPVIGERVPLIKLSELTGNVRLMRTSSEHTIFVPVRARTKLRSAMLHLSLTNSVSLVNQRSALAVRLNDRTIRQVALRGDRPQTTLDIPIPVERLEGAYNKLSFRVAQHYTSEECEDPFAPELWTEIDTTDSYIRYDSEQAPLIPRLADLNLIFSPRDPGAGTLKLVFPASEGISDRTLWTGSLLSQGLALRYQYLPTSFQYEPARPGTSRSMALPGLDERSLVGGDSLLVGTRDALAPFLAPALAQRITGAFLGVYPLASDPSHVVLVVSGRNQLEVDLAASTFAFLDTPFPPTSETLVNQLNVPRWPDYAGSRNMLTNRRYTFKDLGFKTQTLNGYIGEIGQLDFSVPPDLMPWENTKLILHMHYAHGAGLRRDSVMNVSLNRQFSRAVSVDEARGSEVDDYRIEIPMRSLQSGGNVLSFAPKFLPLEGGDCKPVMTDNLIMTLFDDSWLELPEVPHFVRMPNLSLLSRSGFPYTAKPDGLETMLWPTSKDPATLSAAWTLMGRLAQTTGLPLFHATASFEPAAPTQNVLMVGPLDRLPARVRSASPLGAAKASTLIPSSLSPLLGQPLSWFAARDRSPTEPPAHSTAAFQTAWGDQLVGMQFESPYHPKRTLTAFTADSGPRLFAGIQQLIRPKQWGAMNGSFVLWDWKSDQVSAQDVSPSYDVGEVGWLERLSYLIGRYPWPTVAFLLGLALLVAYSIHLVLLRRLYTVHGHGVEDARG